MKILGITQKEAYERCKIYSIGKDVLITRKKDNGNKGDESTHIRGTIAERYPYHLVVVLGKHGKVREGFTYNEIIMSEVLTLSNSKIKNT